MWSYEPLCILKPLEVSVYLATRRGRCTYVYHHVRRFQTAQLQYGFRVSINGRKGGNKYAGAEGCWGRRYLGGCNMFSWVPHCQGEGLKVASYVHFRKQTEQSLAHLANDGKAIAPLSTTQSILDATTNNARLASRRSALLLACSHSCPGHHHPSPAQPPLIMHTYPLLPALVRPADSIRAYSPTLSGRLCPSRPCSLEIWNNISSYTSLLHPRSRLIRPMKRSHSLVGRMTTRSVSSCSISNYSPWLPDSSTDRCVENVGW